MSDTQSGSGNVELAPGVHIIRSSLRYRFSRSRGPGGQNVNKVNSKAELRLAVGSISGLDVAALNRLRRFAGRRLTIEDELVITSDSHRSQIANRTACLERLRLLVARASLPPRTRRKRTPSLGMKRRRREAKQQHSERKTRRNWRAGPND